VCPLFYFKNLPTASAHFTPDIAQENIFAEEGKGYEHQGFVFLFIFEISVSIYYLKNLEIKIKKLSLHQLAVYRFETLKRSLNFSGVR
jgi:hypothetical protein